MLLDFGKFLGIEVFTFRPEEGDLKELWRV